MHNQDAMNKVLSQANKAFESGNFKTAKSVCRCALNANVNFPPAWDLLGLSQLELGEVCEAMQSFEQAAVLDPNNGLYLCHLSLVKQATGDSAGAQELLEKAIATNPESVQAQNNLGLIAKQTQQYELAEACFSTVLRLAPNLLSALINLASVYHATDRTESGISLLKQVLLLEPYNGDAHQNIGVMYFTLQQYSEAYSHYEQALHCDPELGSVYGNLAKLCCETNNYEESLVFAERALEFSVEDKTIIYLKAIALIKTGNLREAWECYESRPISTPKNQSYYPQPVTGKSDLKNQKVLIYAEQGVSDDLIFASLLPEVQKVATHCIYECDPRIQSLLARAYPDIEIVGTKPAIGAGVTTLNSRAAGTVQLSSGSLPRLFRKTEASFKKTDKYLVPEQAAAGAWEAQLAQLPAGLKVGIAWRSKKGVEGFARKYSQLADWGPILSVPQCQFINLQYDDYHAELKAAEQANGCTIVDFDALDTLDDFEGVAALVSQLDLVITAGTAVASLVGALGKPAWLISPHCGWKLQGETLPWFASLRYFNQPDIGDWDGVIGEIATALQVVVVEKGER